MYQDTFAQELATRVGSTVEVFTDNNMVDGILASVTAELVLVIDVTSGYNSTKLFISVDALNFIRFPQAA